MSRKWPIVRFGSRDATAGMVDTSSLSVRGPEGVSLVLSLQRTVDVPLGAPQREMWRQEEVRDEGEGGGEAARGRGGEGCGGLEGCSVQAAKGRRWDYFGAVCPA